MRPQTEINKAIVAQLNTLSEPKMNKNRTIEIIAQTLIKSTGTMRTTLSDIERARINIGVTNPNAILKVCGDEKKKNGVLKGIYVKRMR